MPIMNLSYGVIAEKLATPTFSSSNITNGKSYTWTKSANALTLYYSWNGNASYSSTTSSSISTSITSVTNQTSYAYCGGDDYEWSNSDVASGIINVTAATAPSITVNNLSIGKQIVFTKNTSSGTMYYKGAVGDNYSSTTGSTATYNVTWSGSNTASAYNSGLSGYAASSVTSVGYSVATCTAPSISWSDIGGSWTPTFTRTMSSGTTYARSDLGSSHSFTSASWYTISSYWQANASCKNGGSAPGSRTVSAYTQLDGYVQSATKTSSSPSDCTCGCDCGSSGDD